MVRVVVTCQVEDSVKWESTFRTHGELFRSQTVTAPIGIAINDGNDVAVCFEPQDLGTFFEVLEAPESVEAMAADGVKVETLKVFVMDKEFRP